MHGDLGLFFCVLIAIVDVGVRSYLAKTTVVSVLFSPRVVVVEDGFHGSFR